VQGISVAGEETCVQIPEIDLAFDIGLCPRIALSSSWIALTHAHMDHLGGLPYYFSQRHFLKMTAGRCVCHPTIEGPLRAMMASWIPLEDQRTPHEILALPPGEQIEIKNNLFLRAIPVSHTVPAVAYAVVERRSKLKEEFHDLPQTRLRELKSQGVEITRTLEIPQVAYSGDTEVCPALYSEEFTKARIVITECTFFDQDHRQRSRIGKHLHVDDVINLLSVWEAEHVVLVHVSRRTNMSAARRLLADRGGEENASRVHFLMDHRANLRRYEAQLTAAGAPQEHCDDGSGPPTDEDAD